jgi:hypothetical protein
VPHIYKAWNNAMPTTAAQLAVTTGTAIKTMLQLATPATRSIQIISWGYSVDALQAGVIELIQTDVAATVTAHTAAGLQPTDAGMAPSLLTLGTSATGYTATVEGTTAAARVFDVQQIAATSPDNLEYSYQFMPDERPLVAVSKFLRIRATFGTAVNMRCWVTWAE